MSDLIDHTDLLLLKFQNFEKIFQMDIDYVWDFLKDVKKTYEVLHEFRTEAIFIKGNNSYELGNEFHFIWKKFLKLFFRTELIINTCNYKKLIFRVFKAEPINVNYNFIYTLYRISNNSSTLLLWEWVYDGEGLFINLKEQDLLRCERKRMLELFEGYLKQNFNFIQSESTQINCIATKLWKIITNFDYFIRIAPSLADSVEIDGDYMKPNSIIKIRIRKKYYNLNVIKAEYNKEGIYYYTLSCRDDNIPKQEIRFEISNITENCCFIIYNHLFTEYIDFKLIEKIAKRKKETLKSLKNFFEFYDKY